MRVDSVTVRSCLESIAHAAAVISQVCRPHLLKSRMSMGVQGSNDTEVLENVIVALHIYCGYAAATRAQEFLNEIILPAVRRKEVGPCKAFRQSPRHVVAAMLSAIQIISSHEPPASQPKQLNKFTAKLLQRARQPAVLQAIVAEPDIVQSLSVRNCSTILKCLHDTGSSDALVGREEAIEAFAASFRTKLSRMESGLSCATCVMWFSRLSKLGYRSDQLAADVQRVVGQSLHAKNQTDDKVQRV